MFWPQGFDHGDWQQQREAGVYSQVAEMAGVLGVTTGQLALAWLMKLPGGVIPLVGTANPAHITEAIAAAGGSSKVGTLPSADPMTRLRQSLVGRKARVYGGSMRK